MSGDTSAGLGRQLVDALKVSPALLALMVFMFGILYMVREVGMDNRALTKALVERCFAPQGAIR